MSKHILIVGPAWVGDMVMAQALFKLLRKKKRTQTIDVLAPPWTLPVLSRMPEVNKAIELPIAHGELKLGKRYKIAKALSPINYDQAIILPNSFKSALVPFFAHIKRRTGWLGEARFFLLNDIRHLDETRYPLMIDQFKALGLEKTERMPTERFYPSFQLTHATLHATLDKHKNLFKDRPVLAIAAGAAFGPAKRWPASYFAEVANHQIQAGWDVWLFGSKNEHPIALEIMALTHHRCQNFVGQLDLSETIDLISQVNGVITNDSGLLHVSSALDKPIIAIYGSTDPSFTPPLSDKATVLKLKLECQPCFKRECPLKHYRCLYDLKPERVLHAISAWKI